LVSLQATANPGFVFVRWTGTACAGSTSPSCLLTLTANTTATPSFRARTLVTVVKDGTGAGTVSGPGISCGADCSQAEFDGRAAATGVLGSDAWLVQGVTAEVTGIQVTPELDTVAVGADQPLPATASLSTAAVVP